MITRQLPIGVTTDYPYERSYDLTKMAFFDIETTGFSADSTYLYLIGCVYYKDSSYQMIQWFSEGIHDEVILIHAFFKFLEGYKVLIHYNGNGFDIPYLQHKCNSLHLDYSFDQFQSLDLYKKLLPYKKIFKIKSFRQKSIESFLNIHREDVFDGGDLIEVYSSYLGKKHLEDLRKIRTPDAPLPKSTESDLLLYTLLLHNEDDIKGLLQISPILYYTDLFEKPIHILMAGVEEDLLILRFEISAVLPVRINYGNDLVHLSAYGNSATLKIHIFDGELKYFYDNYKDYYYLPAEDSVMHKSVAIYVDKDYRTKAKPSNCYTKKQGLFAPLYEMIITPCFKMNYQDKLSFLEIHTDFLLQEDNLELYISHMLAHLISKSNS